MKPIKLAAFFLLMTCITLSCKKETEDADPACMDDHTSKVIYTNTGTVPLRVVVATSQTPQFEPVDPLFTIDLAPGASIEKTVSATRYVNIWYSNCSTNCARASSVWNTYAACEEYEEELGL